MSTLHHGPAMIITDAMIEALCRAALRGVICDDNVLQPLCAATVRVEHAIAVLALRSPTRAEYRLRNAVLHDVWNQSIADRRERETWKDGPRTDHTDNVDVDLFDELNGAEAL